MNPISLDTNWRYFPTEVIDPIYGATELDESSWGVLPQISDYPRDLIAYSGTLNLRHTFDLEPIHDVCIRYHLHLIIAPVGTQVFVNGWHIGTFQAHQSLTADVTDYVTLEDNFILLKLSHRGDLSGLSLEPVPCDGIG